MFSVEETNIFFNIYCTILYVILLIFSLKNVGRYNLPNKTIKYNIFNTLLLIFVLTYCVDSDFFHYMTMVKDYDFTPGAYNHGEKFYGYLIYFLDKNYFLFRVFVWGTALLLFYKASKLLKIDPRYSFSILSVLFLLIFSYARASLGMAVFIYGVARYLTSKRLFGKILSFVIIYSSCFFHSSMLAMTILFILAVFMPFNKKMFIAYCLLAIVFALGINQFMDYLITDSFIGADEVINKKLTGYSERDAVGSNFFGMIQNILGYGTFYLPFIIIALKLYREGLMDRMPRNIKFVSKILLLIMILATAFLFLDISSTVFFYRFLYMSMLPMALLISYFIANNQFSLKERKLILGYGAVANIYVLLHSVYAMM